MLNFNANISLMFREYTLLVRFEAARKAGFPAVEILVTEGESDQTLVDAPGRHAPGTGNINFSKIFTEIDKLNYAGWLGAEYIPLGKT